MIKTVFFDYDGVLVDSFANIFKVYKKIINRLGLRAPHNLAEFRKIYGYKHQEAYKNIGVKPSEYERANQLFKKEIVKYRPRVFPGVKKVLNILSQKYKLFLVSSNIKAEVFNKLKYYHLIQCFQAIKADDSPEQFSKDRAVDELIKKYHLNKKEIIFIGDRTIDYDKAIKLGLPKKNILIVEYGWGYDHKKIKMQYKIKKPFDLVRVIEKIDR